MLDRRLYYEGKKEIKELFTQSENFEISVLFPIDTTYLFKDFMYRKLNSCLEQFVNFIKNIYNLNITEENKKILLKYNVLDNLYIQVMQYYLHSKIEQYLLKAIKTKLPEKISNKISISKHLNIEIYDVKYDYNTIKYKVNINIFMENIKKFFENLVKYDSVIVYTTSGLEDENTKPQCELVVSILWDTIYEILDDIHTKMENISYYYEILDELLDNINLDFFNDKEYIIDNGIIDDILFDKEYPDIKNYIFNIGKQKIKEHNRYAWELQNLIKNINKDF